MKKILFFLSLVIFPLTSVFAHNEQKEKSSKKGEYTVKALLRDSARIVSGTALGALGLYCLMEATNFNSPDGNKGFLGKLVKSTATKKNASALEQICLSETGLTAQLWSVGFSSAILGVFVWFSGTANVLDHLLLPPQK